MGQGQGGSGCLGAGRGVPKSHHPRSPMKSAAQVLTWRWQLCRQLRACARWMLNSSWLQDIWPGDSTPVTRSGRGRGQALRRPARLRPRVPWPQAPHQAGPEEVAGAEAPLPGQRAEEGVSQRPPQQLHTTVVGELGLLRGQVAGAEREAPGRLRAGSDGRGLSLPGSSAPSHLPDSPGCTVNPRDSCSLAPGEAPGEAPCPVQHHAPGWAAGGSRLSVCLGTGLLLSISPVAGSPREAKLCLNGLGVVHGPAHSRAGTQ